MQKTSNNHENGNNANTLLSTVLPSTHEVKTEMPMSPLYHTECLWNPDGKGWERIKEIHTMCDLHISFVNKGIVAFPK